MPDYSVYHLKVSTITPLHIGSGRELLKDYDYAVYDRKTWRINDAALLEAQDVDDPKIADQLARTPPAQLLRPQDYTPQSGFFRYVINGTPRAQGEGAMLREQIKDSFDRPYLPGSSLKGALRTALGWWAWQQRGLTLDTRQLNPRREWAAQNFEKALFGKDPNHDLLRALQVSDSAALQAEACLTLVNASVLSRGGQAGKGIPVELEAIRGDTVFELTLKLDAALYSDWAKRHGLHLPNGWLENLPKIIAAHSRQRIAEELRWYEGVRGAERLLTLYQQLQKLSIPETAFLLQLGWGTGWDGKTFGSRLKADPRFMGHILSQYRMTRGRWQAGDPFPKSRRVAVTAQKSPDGRVFSVPASSLGWVLVEMEKA